MEMTKKHKRELAERRFISGLGVPMDNPLFELRQSAAKVLNSLDKIEKLEALDGEIGSVETVKTVALDGEQ